MLVRPPLNHVMIYVFKFMVWRGIIFDRWSFDFIFLTNQDGLYHSARITFPGNIKSCLTLSLPFFLTDPSSRHTISTRREHIQHLGHYSFRRPFLYHLFLPPRPTGPWNFRLNAQFLLWYLQLLSSICTTHSTKDFVSGCH